MSRFNLFLMVSWLVDRHFFLILQPVTKMHKTMTANKSQLLYCNHYQGRKHDNFHSVLAVCLMHFGHWLEKNNRLWLKLPMHK